MAYPNQDFGEAAPPDSGGHSGAFTRPDALFDANRRDNPQPVPPLRTRTTRPRPLTLQTLVWWAAAGAVILLSAAVVLAAT